MNQAVLVTGADGFIGSHLVNALRGAGVCVVEHSIGDGDIAGCDLSHDGIEHVFHLAGRSFVPDSWREVRAFCETNLLGAINVLEFCRRTGASLTCISSYVYGQPLRLPIGEDHPRGASNPYALSKIMAEDACLFYAANLGVRVCIVRPFNIYGPGQARHFLIPELIEQAVRGESGAIIVADARPKRDYLHVADLVELLLSTWRNRACGVYNAGSGSAVSIAELVETITGITGARRLVSRDERRPNEILEVRADIRKAQRQFGWHPRIGLREGIAGLIVHRS